MGQVRPASKEVAGGGSGTGKWSQFRDRAAIARHGETFACDDAIEHLATMVPEFTNGHLDHEDHCITRDTHPFRCA